MANRYRGEIEAELGGQRRMLVLTLGALAELESAFRADDLMALAERFASGRLSAQDVIRIIGAGLRGAGACVDDDEVAALTAAAWGLYVKFRTATVPSDVASRPDVPVISSATGTLKS